MKKVILMAIIGLSLICCDFKDKNGNAPLIYDGTGKLIYNPEYKTDAQIEYDEKMQSARDEYELSEKDDGTEIKESGGYNKEDRISFAKNFKPKTGSTEVKLSGSDKTTIKLISGFNTEFTEEQYDKLGYFNVFRNYGFKKVVFSNGKEIITTIDL